MPNKRKPFFFKSQPYNKIVNTKLVKVPIPIGKFSDKELLQELEYRIREKRIIWFSKSFVGNRIYVVTDNPKEKYGLELMDLLREKYGSKKQQQFENMYSDRGGEKIDNQN